MECSPWTRWFRPRSQDPCGGVELLFHGGRNKGDVLWRPWNGQDQERLAPDSREGETSQLQLPRSDRHCSQPLSWCALYHCFRTFAPYPTGLALGWRRGAPVVPARCRFGQRLTAFGNAVQPVVSACGKHFDISGRSLAAIVASMFLAGCVLLVLSRRNRSQDR